MGENCIIEVDTNFNRFTRLNPLGRHIDKVLVDSAQATAVASKILKLEFIMFFKRSHVYTLNSSWIIYSEFGLDSQFEAIQTL